MMVVMNTELKWLGEMFQRQSVAQCAIEDGSQYGTDKMKGTLRV
jgi:hypothetical protein